MDIKNYYLDIDLIWKGDKHLGEKLLEMYRDMVYCNEDGRHKISECLFNTLYNNGYLKDVRQEKIEMILDGNNSVNS